jgi:hypothetical protein
MANNKIKTRIQSKHDLEVNWLQATFAPLEGELIIYDKEVDSTGKVKVDAAGKPLLPEGRTTPYTFARFKIGDGHTSVTDLPFAGSDISCGTGDPDATTLTQFYFKYSN